MKKKLYIMPAVELTWVSTCDVMKIDGGAGESSGSGMPLNPAPRRKEEVF